MCVCVCMCACVFVCASAFKIRANKCEVHVLFINRIIFLIYCLDSFYELDDSLLFKVQMYISIYIHMYIHLALINYANISLDF